MWYLETALRETKMLLKPHAPTYAHNADPPASMHALLSGLSTNTAASTTGHPMTGCAASPKTTDKPTSYLRQLEPNLPPIHKSYLELLRRRPYEERKQVADQMLQATIATLGHDDLDAPLRPPLANLLAHTLASGRDRISGQEIFWRLRLTPKQQAVERRAICRVLRSLGWARVRYGPQNKRIWGWRWREWNVSHVKIDLNS